MFSRHTRLKRVPLVNLPRIGCLLTLVSVFLPVSVSILHNTNHSTSSSESASVPYKRSSASFRFPDSHDTVILVPTHVEPQQAPASARSPPPPAIPTASDDEELEVLQADIRQLDEMLQAQMRLKKPTISSSPSGTTFNLLPKPNFSFLPDLSPLRQLFQWSSDSVRSHSTCYACKVGFGLFLTKARLKTTLNDVASQATFACKFFQIASEEVCAGLIERFAPTLYYIGTSKADLTSITFCAMVLQSAAGCITKDPAVDWSILEKGHDLLVNNLPAAVPGAIGVTFPPWTRPGPLSRDSSSRAIQVHGPPVVPMYVKTTKILHLTDIHLDLEYSPGANSNCHHELCCRVDDGPGPPGAQAGYYGDYNGCDLPIHSLENALQQMSKTHPDISLIYMTGDLVSHEVWKTNIERNIEVIQVGTAVIRKYFPRTTLIPVLGNHETHPVNLYSTFGTAHPLGTDWIYEATAKAWEGWIPKESLPTYLKAGYFDVGVPNTNLRVVVLNTNLCYTFNFWQIYDGRDPGGQLDWLVSVLQKAESRYEKVHIIGHVPPNQNECWFIWARNYYEIITRFSSTVKAQFYGHTHYDGFHLYYNSAGRPISPIWIGASVTPFTKLNPGYKIFEADGERGFSSTWNILDHETWIYNLTDANLNPALPPKWFRLYKATDAYQLSNMLPESLDILMHRMATEEEFFYKYYRYYHKAAEIALKEPCDTLCRKRVLCHVVTPYFTRVEECLRVEAEVDGIVLPRTWNNTRASLPSLLLPPLRPQRPPSAPSSRIRFE